MAVTRRTRSTSRITDPQTSDVNISQEVNQVESRIETSNQDEEIIDNYNSDEEEEKEPSKRRKEDLAEAVSSVKEDLKEWEGIIKERLKTISVEDDPRKTTNIEEWWTRAKEIIQNRYEKNRVGRDIIKEIIMNEEIGNLEEYGYDHNKTKIKTRYCGVITESKFKIKIIEAAEGSLKNMLEIMNLEEMFSNCSKINKR